MPFREPNPPGGSSAMSTWLRKLGGAVRANQVLSGRGYKVKRTSSGTILEMDPPTGGGAAAGALKQYRFKTHYGDYLACVPFDGTTEGSSVNIAKQFKLRYSITAETDIYGVAWTMATFDTTYLSRIKSTSGGASEKEGIRPMYLLNDLIYAMPVDHTGVTVSGAELKLIQVNDGRVWCRLSDQS